MGREIQTIRWCSLCVFNLATDVLSRFMLRILRDDRDEPFERRRHVQHARLKCAGRSRNLVSQRVSPCTPCTQLASVLLVRSGETVAHSGGWLTEDKKKNRTISQGHTEPLTQSLACQGKHLSPCTTFECSSVRVSFGPRQASLTLKGILKTNVTLPVCAYIC